MEIIVDTADKGGAILVYPPQLAEKKIEEKVTDKNLYIRMNTDPSEKMYDKLIDLWKSGKAKNFVTEEEAWKVVGLTPNNQKSTASRFKPGDTYFNPSMKIHKMNLDEIKPGCDPPARLITCLQDGVTSRSDIFIAEKWLKQLQKQFCLDIVQDSMEVLNWLSDLDKMPTETKKTFKPFTRGGVRQKFAERMPIWWVPKAPVCKFFSMVLQFFSLVYQGKQFYLKCF